MKIELKEETSLSLGGEISTAYYVILNGIAKYCSSDKEKAEKVYEETKARQSELKETILKSEKI